MDCREFEEFARVVMSGRLGVELLERKIPNFPKRFDMVSADCRIVGDAKYLRLVDDKRTPPAKLMEIAAHVWLLEKVPAVRRFLVFGNQIEVPKRWLRKYQTLLPADVQFYFLYEGGRLEQLENSPR